MMDHSNDRHKAIDMVNLLVAKGKLMDDRYLKNDCFKVIMKALGKKGLVEEKVKALANGKGTFHNVGAFLTTAFRNLPDLPKEMTVEEEIEAERADLMEVLELADELDPDDEATNWYEGLGKDFLESLKLDDDSCLGHMTPPNAERFGRHPSILDCSVYEGRQADYAGFTWLVVAAQAHRENTSMHEICRRYGLTYEWLIM